MIAPEIDIKSAMLAGPESRYVLSHQVWSLLAVPTESINTTVWVVAGVAISTLLIDVCGMESEVRVEEAHTSVNCTLNDSISNVHEGQELGEFMYIFTAIGEACTSDEPEFTVRVSLEIEKPRAAIF